MNADFCHCAGFDQILLNRLGVIVQKLVGIEYRLAVFEKPRFQWQKIRGLCVFHFISSKKERPAWRLGTFLRICFAATADNSLCQPTEFSNDPWYRLNESSWGEQGVELGPEWIENNAVFMSGVIEDTEMILRPDLMERRTQKTIECSAVRSEKSAPSVSDNTLVATIAALLASFPPGKQPSGKDLERAASSIGVSVSDDSIRKALNLAKEIAPSLKSA